METWEKELLAVNAVRQAKIEVIEKSVETDLEKAKYFKREGSPGHYKYYYTEAEYKKAKGDSKYSDSKPSDMKHGDGSSLTKEEQSAHEKNQQGLKDLTDYSKQEQSSGKKSSESDKIYTDSSGQKHPILKVLSEEQQKKTENRGTEWNTMKIVFNTLLKRYKPLFQDKTSSGRLILGKGWNLDTEQADKLVEKIKKLGIDASRHQKGYITIAPDTTSKHVLDWKYDYHGVKPEYQNFI